MAAKHPHILRTTCTATALSVMLAACGDWVPAAAVAAANGTKPYPPAP